MNDRSEFLDKIYINIDNQRKKYGQFKKCEFHMHTPASKCYKLIASAEDINDDNGNNSGEEKLGNYFNMTSEEVLSYAKEIGYINEHIYNEMMLNIDEYKNQKYSFQLNNNTIEYNSFKEYLTYRIIAYKLTIENIELAVISDHNTIEGYDKLLYVINEQFKNGNLKKSNIKLFLGVEISCSDKNHLMVIIDEKYKNNFNDYLKSIIMGDRLGTYYDTRTVIKDVEKFNAITYIAHANSSEFYGNEIYKREMLNLKSLHGFGIKKFEHKDLILNRIQKFNNNLKNTAFILEADSHSIDELGRKNCWVKLSNIDFKALKKAFLNHSICIYNKEPNSSSTYIKGLAIERGESGFLGSNPNGKKIDDKLIKDYMIINFSKDLNCIIGGKGTGKSTILNLIELIYSRETDDFEFLSFTSQHRRIYSLFIFNNEEYLLEFIPQVISKGEYSYTPSISKKSYKKINEMYKLNTNWYNLFKINKYKNKNNYRNIEKKEIDIILKRVFKRGYNINKLVNKISNNKISDYIRDVMMYTIEYEEINSYIQKIKRTSNRSFLKELRENIDYIIDMIEYRKKIFNKKIDDFNKNNLGVIEIRYMPMNSYDYFEEFLEILSKRNYKFELNFIEKCVDDRDENIDNTYLTWGDLEKYFSDARSHWNYFEILKLILNKELQKMNKVLPLINYEGIEEKYSTVNRGLIHVKKAETIKKINSAILNKFKNNIELLKENIINCFKVMDNFELYFNINNKEDITNLPVEFKNIKQLSSGQKVAALLTFVFNFGIITNDNTPLIIDQPEDNLDNTYIYKNLVESLKSIKNNRQVIIVTHSSTIVTNADAEEVIVLKSNNKQGWIEKHGYPSEKSIIKHILNYLEGGENSFNHKYSVYNVILSEKII